MNEFEAFRDHVSILPMAKEEWGSEGQTDGGTSL